MCRGQLIVEPEVVRVASTVVGGFLDDRSAGVPERETPREVAERELLAVREEVRQLAESMRARLDQDEDPDGHQDERQDEQQKKQQDEQASEAGRWES
jgi:hypothetical protein